MLCCLRCQGGYAARIADPTMAGRCSVHQSLPHRFWGDGGRGEQRGEGVCGLCHMQEPRSRNHTSFEAPSPPTPSTPSHSPNTTMLPAQKHATACSRGEGGAPSVLGRCHVQESRSRNHTSFRRLRSAVRPPKMIRRLLSGSHMEQWLYLHSTKGRGRRGGWGRETGRKGTGVRGVRQAERALLKCHLGTWP